MSGPGPERASIGGNIMVELGRIELPTYSMRTSRATNCAIAPRSLAGYQPCAGLLLTGRPGQVEPAAVRHLVEMLEDRVLVVDVEHHRPRSAQPRGIDVDTVPC